MANSPDVEEPTREYPAVDDGAGSADSPPALDPPPTTEPPTTEPPTTEPPAAEPPARVGGFARLLIFTAFVFALMVAACLGLRAIHVLSSFSNPFASKTTDRSQPVLLQSMRDLSRYVAADGTFQVIVDLQQDKNNVPDFLVNERTLFVGSGTVEEYVEFGSLNGNALKVDNDKKSIQLTLPPPQQSTAALDMTKSYVVAEQRGLLNRIGDAFSNDPNKQQRVYQMAQQRITDAAKSSGLDQRAEANTQKMLESLFTRLGFTSVSVTFTNP